MLDALLTLNAPPSATGAVQPAVMVALKGPLPAPKRTVDTNLLSSWLTLRAVEQQSRQIDGDGAGRSRGGRRGRGRIAAEGAEPEEPPVLRRANAPALRPLRPMRCQGK